MIHIFLLIDKALKKSAQQYIIVEHKGFGLRKYGDWTSREDVTI